VACLGLGLVQLTRGVPITVELRQWLLALVATLIGVRVVAYAPGSWLGWLFLLVGLTAGLSVAAGALASSWAAWWDDWVWWPSYALLPAVLLVFPTGRPASSRWTVVLALALAGALVSTTSLAWASWQDPGFLDSDGSSLRGVARMSLVTGFVMVAMAMAAGLLSVGHRWWRSTGVERRMLGWSVVGGLLLVLATVPEFLGVPGVWVAAVAALPAAAVVAITRFGLHDIDLLLHRSLLYALLTLSVLAVHAAAVAGFSRLAPDSAEGLAVVAAVLAVQPLRSSAQQRVDRYVYGERNAPYQVLSGLNEQLARPADPSEVLSVIASSVAAALKLPWVGISIGSDPVPSATHGRSRGWPTTSLPCSTAVRRSAPDRRGPLPRGALHPGRAAAAGRPRAQTGPAVSRRCWRRTCSGPVSASCSPVRRSAGACGGTCTTGSARARGGPAAADRPAPTAALPRRRRPRTWSRPSRRTCSRARPSSGHRRRPAPTGPRPRARRRPRAGGVPARRCCAGRAHDGGRPRGAAGRDRGRRLPDRLRGDDERRQARRRRALLGPDRPRSRPGRRGHGRRGRRRRRAAGRVGLGSMRERAEELGGSLEIRPHHPKGTCVHASLPA
jgi:hypothetical protein